MGMLTGNHEFDETPQDTPLQSELVVISNKIRDLENLANSQHAQMREDRNAIEQMTKVIDQQETAICLLKQYVLEAGLPAFWDPKVTTTLPKPVGQMTADELIARNKNMANNYKRAASGETKRFPTFEEMVDQYTPKKPTPISDLMDSQEATPTAVEPGEVNSKYFDDEDSSPFFGSEDT